MLVNPQAVRDKPIAVLYVHHAAPFGGASRSLLEMIQSFPAGAVQPSVLTRRGQFQEILEAAGVAVLGCGGVSQFDNTRYSHYRGWRWLVLLRELAYLTSTLRGLLAAKWNWGRVDLVHINDVTLLPAIWLARRLFNCPVIVHVRSVQQPLRGWRGRLVASVLRGSARRLIAIDETVKASLDPSLDAVVIHNCLRVARGEQSPAAVHDRFTVGMVGGLSRAKGCLEFVEAAALCRAQGADIRFVFVGQSMRRRSPLRDFVLRRLGLSQEIEEELKAQIEALALADAVEFWPFTTDLEKVYRQFDVVCFPSHFDAPGRPIFEAAFFGVPSIAAVTQPMGDTIVDGVTGLAVRPREPRRLAEAILSLYANPEKRAELGRNAARLAHTHFDADGNALRVLGVYREAVLPAAGGRP
ncbi:MAG: glycosyltransferase family 4 protein [Burkholderiales bacterium]|nr:D-inositol-3-phosphate glycosyltransferase [Rhodocyclaceae bacterium]MCZ2175350.1 glycosyltransferase family 4 protein [Burkholderiales bacterium]MCZ2420956.1 glycosyltransferase family 4 protein [Burkholderiales bacterium]